jgi:glycosyltransferase involved in cell wall biosynthesis
VTINEASAIPAPEPGADPRPKFSIVIPCLNEARYLTDTVRSLQAQTFTGAYEIVVVDNNSTDETAEIARAMGVRVVFEQHPGVCWARQRGSLAAAGEIIVSADADTTYAPDWLATIDRAFREDDRVVAVAGPCRYVGGPRWGRAYARMLFATVNFVNRWTGRPFYVTATNIAFRKDQWSGYDVHLTQGGDELALLRQLRRRGRVRYVHTNPTFTSSRRLTRGPLYGLFVTLLVYYLLAYLLNRWFNRRVIGSAPAYRSDRTAFSRRVQAVGVAVLVGTLVVLWQR